MEYFFQPNTFPLFTLLEWQSVEICEMSSWWPNLQIYVIYRPATTRENCGDKSPKLVMVSVILVSREAPCENHFSPADLQPQFM